MNSKDMDQVLSTQLPECVVIELEAGVAVKGGKRTEGVVRCKVCGRSGPVIRDCYSCP